MQLTKFIAVSPAVLALSGGDCSAPRPQGRRAARAEFDCEGGFRIGPISYLEINHGYRFAFRLPRN